jgi:hypothetical protein
MRARTGQDSSERAINSSPRLLPTQHKKRASMPSAGFEPATSATARPRSYAYNRADNGIGIQTQSTLIRSNVGIIYYLLYESVNYIAPNWSSVTIFVGAKILVYSLYDTTADWYHVVSGKTRHNSNDCPAHTRLRTETVNSDSRQEVEKEICSCDILLFLRQWPAGC